MSWNTVRRSAKKRTTEVETLRLCYLEWIELCGDAMLETTGNGVPLFLEELSRRAEAFNVSHLVHLANEYRYQNGVDALWKLLYENREHSFWYHCLLHVCDTQDSRDSSLLHKLIKGIGIGDQWNIFELVFATDVDNFWRTSARIWREFLEVFDGVRGRDKEKKRLRAQFETWKSEYIKIGRTLPSDELSKEEKEFKLESILDSEFQYKLLTN